MRFLRSIIQKLIITTNFLPLLFRCVQPNLCDEDREKTNINLSIRSQVIGMKNEDILHTLITSAQNAECPEKGARCCSTKFITSKGTG